MSNLSLDTFAEKTKIINKLNELLIFCNNNQGCINPTKIAEIMQTQQETADKARELFSNEKQLDEVINKFDNEVNKQIELIDKQKKTLSNYEKGLSEQDHDDEYQGVISDV